ncbi:CHASE2 and HATPase_c domain-containing protein [Paenalcaligenes niemegkensis]|uniref:CHASE2 and HATPase_c domain-containing protein n=1 Tax=Paenalcaligenes niemegkensis TaxID=2895469 RepID=UPI001EE9A14D|nr:CHASE2 and HATPase_c domain-containing protein [Paenalcaligenes niemegkensis]MCQ9617820.1 CHASE2 and HATPase_c domain-containing protein [Paenalcaligenes niemegkensis]
MPIPSSSTGARVRSGSLARQVQFEWRLVTVLLLLMTLALSLFRHELKLSQIDNSFYDFQMKLSIPSEVDRSIALVVIDEGSIKTLGYWPWRRAEHAKLLGQLQQAKAVGFDIVFQDENPAYPLDDHVFAQALQEHGRGVLPVIVQNGNTYAELPLPPLATAASQLGFINIFPDPDGVVRRADMSLHTQDGQSWQHMVLAMLRAGGDENAAETLINDKHQQHLIPFSGKPGHFETYSYAAVLAGNYPADTFKDRYVLVGAWSSGLGDFYPTPRSWIERTSMSGVEILANTLSNARTNHWISEQRRWITAIASLLPVYLVCIILIRFSPRRAFIATIGLMFAIFIGDWFLLHVLNIWSPPTASLICTMLAYPVWHWRSQETVLRHVNQELSALSAQDPTLRLALQAKEHTETLPIRLSFLHRGIELLREAQQRREQTLRFISHDMRAPQNSILALVSMQRAGNDHLAHHELLEKMEDYANATLELVDNFMDLARAEAMELEFTELYSADLMSAVCDDAWSRAQEKKITLLFDEPSNAPWIKANAPMLKRALSNLVDNAIKYSSPHTIVECAIAEHDEMLVIRISDQGWGIPEHLQATIFQPFLRAHVDDHNAPGGSGIGLAFVETVVQRHHGHIELDSKVNEGSSFTIYLPAVQLKPESK